MHKFRSLKELCSQPNFAKVKRRMRIGKIFRVQPTEREQGNVYRYTIHAYIRMRQRNISKKQIISILEENGPYCQGNVSSTIGYIDGTFIRIAFRHHRMGNRKYIVILTCYHI